MLLEFILYIPQGFIIVIDPKKKIPVNAALTVKNFLYLSYPSRNAKTTPSIPIIKRQIPQNIQNNAN